MSNPYKQPLFSFIQENFIQTKGIRGSLEDKFDDLLCDIEFHGYGKGHEDGQKCGLNSAKAQLINLATHEFLNGNDAEARKLRDLLKILK